MAIDWNMVYDQKEEIGKKFDRLIQPIPWTSDYQQNLSDTLEWLVRSGRAKEIRYQKEPLVNLVTDNWYRYEALDGMFFHICYPREMLAYRLRYDGLHFNMLNSRDIHGANKRVEHCRAQLWIAYRCFGSDGARSLETNVPIDDTDGTFLEDHTATLWAQKWANKCSRCQTELPRALKAYVAIAIKLQGIQ